MKIILKRIIGRIALLMACFVPIILTAPPVRAESPFMDAATNPSFMRDVHVLSAGENRIDNAVVGDGQKSGMSYDYGFVASNIWNNEHNQILGGVQYGRRTFDQQLVLPDSMVMPERLDNVSAGLMYKHITSGDWALSQAVSYTRSWTNSPSIDVKDTVDLVGLAAISHKPGEAWVFGYFFDQSTDTKNHFYPVIEYVNAAHDRWTITVGYPVLSASFSPHPDWALAGGGGISVSYKVTEQNFVHLSSGGDAWAYRLEGPNTKSVAYKAQNAVLGWTYLYFIDHRTVAVLNANLGWEFDRKLGSDNTVSLDNAAVMGLNLSLSF